MFRSKIEKNNEGIYDFGLNNEVTKKVNNFYEPLPFPNYSKDDDKRKILDIGNKNYLSQNFKKFVGYGKTVLEVGSGTSQLSIYLAVNTNNKICAFDGTYNSLKQGKLFCEKENIKNVDFVRGDLFENFFENNYFDYIWCSGVLHHTKNPKKGFENIIRFLKVNGYVLVGLYNRYGRILTVLRQLVCKLFGEKILFFLDPYLRLLKKNKEKNKDKINSWINDQYLHPVESLHTIDEVLKWFKENNIEYYTSIPSCDFEKISKDDEKNFNLQDSKGDFFLRLFRQIQMIFTRLGKEGGLFIVIGKKL